MEGIKTCGAALRQDNPIAVLTLIGGWRGIRLTLAVLELKVDDTSKDEVIYLLVN
jgi:hypothetical protein